MKNIIKNKKGITLIALIITIILLLILASVATYSGIEIINSSRLTTFTTEMKIMQTEVNELYQKYIDNNKIEINGDTYYGKDKGETEDKTILQIGEELTDSQKELLDKLATETSIVSSDGYRYWNEDLLEDLQIDGIESDFLVNIEKRSIVSCQGLNYQNKMYYTLEQLPNNLYNVEYNNPNTNKPNFDISQEKLGENKWKINISNIQYSGYIDKWKIQYKLNEEGENDWKTTEDLNFTINKRGIYKLRITNGNIISDEKKILVETPVEIPEKDGETFSRENGTISIKFLKGTSYDTGEANNPKIEKSNMVPVNLDGTDWVVTDEKDWDYSYGETDGTKKWANVMLRDTLELEGMDNQQVQTATIEEMKGKKVTTEGSMLVWIPRYAYKITYYSDSSKQEGTEIGYSDARGLVDKRGKTPTGMESPVTSIAVEDNYRPHPAFEDNNSTNSQKEYSQGEWSSKLTGIWVGKFETTEQVNSKITIRPNQSSYVNKKIGEFYTDSQNLGIADSHMIKNSEWGAMAYLTESKYGINGKSISANTNENLKTGSEDYKKNTAQSTTGNIYGIYDTVGGAYEYVSSYIANNSQQYGNSFASTNNSTNNKSISTKYSTVYNIINDNSSPIENYNANINKIFGDGIIETSTQGNNHSSWHSAQSNFVGLSSNSDIGNLPFLGRGGSAINSSYPGLLYFSYNSGYGGNDMGFRVCLIVE